MDTIEDSAAARELARIEARAIRWAIKTMGRERAHHCLTTGRGMLGPFAMAGVFDPKEEALVRLALDDAASVGEQDNAARALIRSLRKRGVDPEQVITGRELVERTKQPSVYHLGSQIFPWGKFQGCRVDSVPEKYLRFCLWKTGRSQFTINVIRPFYEALKRNGN